MTSLHKQIANYLEQNTSLYPYGVPIRSLRQALDSLPRPTPETYSSKQLVFVTDNLEISEYKGAAGQLWQAAIEKGLKLKIDDVSHFLCKDCDISLFKDLLAKDSVVLLLGKTAQSWFCENIKDKSDLCSKMQYVEVLDPIDVVNDPQLKRTLWNQLKKVINIL